MDTSVLTQTVQHYIGGQRTGAAGGGGRTADVFDPAVGKPARRVLLASRADVDAAVHAAAAAFPGWAATTPRWLPRGPWRVMAIAVLADQATKAAALAWLASGSVAVLPFFNLTLGFNTGASFGMLSGVMADRPMLMVLLTGAFTLGLAAMAYHTRGVERSGFALIAGGAAGNIVDRLTRGAVTDFLDFHWQGWHWPAFNLADVSIFVGAVMVLFTALSRKARAHV